VAQRTPLQPLRQRLAFQVLHHQINNPAVLADIVQHADMRMVQVGRGARFTLQTLAAGGVVGEHGGQDFDSHCPIEPRVPRAIDLTHSTRADRLEDLVGTKSLAGGKCHSCWQPSTHLLSPY
jgi:hypothetical protein